jgi:hypothetical protein
MLLLLHEPPAWLVIYNVFMTRDTAVQLALQALANDSIRGFEFLRAVQETEEDRKYGW